MEFISILCFENDQITAAQVEIYPTKNSKATTDHMDSSHSVSPTTTWNSRKAANSREIDPAHGRPEGMLPKLIPSIFSSQLIYFRLSFDLFKSHFMAYYLILITKFHSFILSLELVFKL